VHYVQGQYDDVKDFEKLAKTLKSLEKGWIENKNLPVIGEGSHFAKIMFIGEAPGRNEAKTGRPFCGAAGKILDELLGAVGIERSEIYVTNIVKDRPPQNRDKENVFCEGNILSGADVGSFILKGKNGMPQDKLHRYNRCESVE
jgi:uracil-DNA glycosylase